MLLLVVLVNFTKKQINIAYLNNNVNRYSVKQILVTLKSRQLEEISFIYGSYHSGSFSSTYHRLTHYTVFLSTVQLNVDLQYRLTVINTKTLKAGCMS